MDTNSQECSWLGYRTHSRRKLCAPKKLSTFLCNFNKIGARNPIHIASSATNSTNGVANSFSANSELRR